MKKTFLLIMLIVLTMTSGQWSIVNAQKYVGGDISMLKKFVDEGAISAGMEQHASPFVC